MDYVSEGIIIEEINTLQITYMNNKSREIFNISENGKISEIKQVLKDGNAFHSMHENIMKSLEENNSYKGIMYIKNEENSFAEVSFNCTWIDKSKNLIGYVLENVIEIENNNEEQFIFKEVAEFLPSGVSVMDMKPELTVTYANHEHYKILGLDESKQEFNSILKESLYEEDKDWVMSEIYDSLHKGTDVDIEFRMKVKGNKLKWVRLFGRAKESATGSTMFYSSLKDLSARREINDKLHLERILLHKITELTSEILFRLDLETNIIHFLGKQFSEVFGENPVMENFPYALLKENIIYEEDLPVFHDMLECFDKGIAKLVEVRLNMSEGNVVWHQILYSFIKNSEGKTLLVIGKLINIQKQKWLEEQATIDLLTGFLNKIHTANEINKLLEESESDDEHVLFIIDIDNFKGINDNLGHHFGDIVLHDIAEDIRNCFRKKDILGRIGGDEFVVVMKDCNDDKIIIDKANMVCNALMKTFTGNKDSYSISASIGVSKYPINGANYDKLYQMADIALYRTKEKGKNNFTIYTTDLQTEQRLTPSTIHRSKRNSNDIIDFTIVLTVFNLLYETSDIRLSLKTILEYLCNAYNVERCYIFQTLDGGNIYRNDFQWEKGKGIIKDDEIISVKEEILMGVFNEADEDGVFYTDNIYVIKEQGIIEILEKDEVVSMFLVESLKTQERKAFFGMDDCKNKRTWTDYEIRTLFHVARIIFGALTGYNVISNLKKSVIELENKCHSLSDDTI